MLEAASFFFFVVASFANSYVQKGLKEVNQSHYRPGVAQRVTGSSGSQIS